MNKPNDAILLTDDGHPIGDIVIADDRSVPALPNERTVEENREDMMRHAASDLTGDPNADTAVASLYPGYEDTDLRKRATVLFVSEGKDLSEVASAVGVPERTVSMWMYNFKWDELVKRELAARQSSSIIGLARLRTDKRLEIAKAQLEQAGKIREKAIASIEQKGISKTAADAWASAARVEHTITGVSEAGTVADVDGKDGDKKDKVEHKTLVCVFNGSGGLPPVR